MSVSFWIASDAAGSVRVVGVCWRCGYGSFEEPLSSWTGKSMDEGAGWARRDRRG